MKTFKIAVLGCGTVGGGVAKILTEINQELSERANCQVELSRIVELNAPAAIDRFKLSPDFFVDGNNTITENKLTMRLKAYWQTKK